MLNLKKQKISIITSVYNGQEFIQKTINSIANQSYKNIEYIVIDGNSSDTTKNIIKQNISKISTFISEDDSGIYDGLNKGFAKATGDIIGLLHSDDEFYDENTIEDIAKIFEDDNISILYGNLIYTDKSGEKIVRNWISKPYQKGMISDGWMPAHPTLFVRKSVYERLGLYDGLFDKSFKIASDYDLILRLFLLLEQENLSSYYLPKVITKMRLGGASNKSISNIIHKTKDDINALSKNGISPFKAILYKNFSKISQFFK